MSNENYAVVSTAMQQSTPNNAIIERLRAQLAEHLATDLFAPPSTRGLDLDQAVEAAGNWLAHCEKYRHGHFLRQLAFLEIPGSIRLETLNRDSGGPWREWESACMAATAKSIDAAWLMAKQVPPQAQGVYLIPQVLIEKWRAPTKWAVIPRHGGVKSNDVERVGLCYIDFDCDKRVKGGMASEEEVWETADVAFECYAEIVQILGGERGLGWVFSGNGIQPTIRHKACAQTLVELARRRLLYAIKAKYSGRYEKRVDTSVADLKRLWPVAGTLKAKGTCTAERPHRYTGFWSHEGGEITVDEFLRLVDHFERLSPRETIFANKKVRIFDGKPSRYAPANALPIKDVWFRLGLGDLYCPGCGGRVRSEVSWGKYNTVRCWRNTCEQKRHHTCIDLVIHRIGGDATSAYAWLAGRFELPPLGAQPKIETDEGMSIDAPDGPPVTIPSQFAPKRVTIGGGR